MAGDERYGVHEQISGQFIRAMDEVAGEQRCPWHSRGGHLHLPRNVASGNAYQGINILALWAAGILRGYDSGTVGSRRQWKAAGVELLEGETASTIVLYRGHRSRDADRPRFMASASPVFFVEQTDAYTPVFIDDPPCESEIIEAGEAYMATSGARFRFGGRRAFYDPDSGIIHLPPRGAFRGTRTSSPVQSFYATALHELGHWSGGKGRLERRFGDDAAAAEELVAELFAAFKCAELGIKNQLRPDHARYHRRWHRLMQADSRALFRAAAAASHAVRYVDAWRAPIMRPVPKPDREPAH